MGKKRKRRRTEKSWLGKYIWYMILGIVAASVVVLLVLAFTRPTGSSATPTPDMTAYADTREDPFQVGFLGDSFTGGSNEGGFQDRGWPSILGKELKFEVARRGHLFSSFGGTGYLRKGDTTKNFIERVDNVAAQLPDIIIVAGGINDAEAFTPAEIEAGASEVFARIRAKSPTTHIVVVGPFHPLGSKNARSLVARDAIFRAATAKGVTTMIDPLPWFDSGLIEIGSDNTHPTDAGHAEIARLLLTVLSPIAEAERARDAGTG